MLDTVDKFNHKDLYINYFQVLFFAFKLFYGFCHHLHLRIYTLHLYYICIFIAQNYELNARGKL